MQRRFPKGYYKQFFPKDGIPERVYKYFTINDDLKNTLKEGYLWFSRPSDFNDPFDCATNLVDYSNAQSYVKKLVESRFSHLPRKERRAKGQEITKDGAKITMAYEQVAKKITQQMGICCLTTKNDDILMWSHYANKHKGLCLSFDPYDNPLFFLLAEVRY